MAATWSDLLGELVTVSCKAPAETLAMRPTAPPARTAARVGYLGPAGTFSEEALLSAAAADQVQPIACETIYDTGMAVVRGEVDWAVLPIENSLEGSLTVTLDLLAENAAELEVVAEMLLAVRHCLAAAVAMPLREIRTVLSHPQVPGQCRALLREQLPHAQVLPANSTAEAVRLAAQADPERRVAAIGTELAAELYGAAVLARDVQDRDDNLTRFVWLGNRRCAAPPPIVAPREAPQKTSLVFWGPGADRPGWLVRCLDEFARRSINLTKIESRPRRQQMGHYMFFVDLEGDAARDAADAVAGLRRLCEQVWVLGSYPSASGEPVRRRP